MIKKDWISGDISIDSSITWIKNVTATNAFKLKGAGRTRQGSAGKLVFVSGIILTLNSAPA
jgi:hypothetical protein